MSRALLQLSVGLAVIAVGGTVVLRPTAEQPVATRPAPPKARPLGSPPPEARHVLDLAEALPPGDLPRFNDYMDAILQESGVDVRFAFLALPPDESIEQAATRLMDELEIGQRAGQERGVLLVYDVSNQRLRVEVGYGLEAWFPDAFVNSLLHDHARMYFASGDLSLGLRLMLRLLQHRIREAVVGDDFDPRVLEHIRPLQHLSGGGGASTRAAAGDPNPQRPAAAPIDPEAYPAGRTPQETHRQYLRWLAAWPVSPQVDLFTVPSRRYLDSVQFSQAYTAFILLGEAGKRFQVVERGDLALLYFTDTPFTSPHFFTREAGRWRLDLWGEIRNTREYVGGAYTWSYIGADDPYTRAFADQLIEIRGLRRFRGGDNRPLVNHGPG